MSNQNGKITPMMQQYYGVKNEYPDCVIFFRLGDFYEMFGDDATECATILDITLTSRSKADDALPMCGVPYHSADGYILKLTHAGKKVAICEQVSDPALPGLVKREVVRVITPGTNIDESYLETKINNHILSLVGENGRLGVAFADVSTGACHFDLVAQSDLETVIKQVSPNEVLIDEKLFEEPSIYQLLLHYQLPVSKCVNCARPLSIVQNQLKISDLAGFDIDANKDGLVLQALANLFNYLRSTQKHDLPHLHRVQRLNKADTLILDATTIQNLELFQTNRDFSRRGSLFSLINKSTTKAGGRVIADWLVRPLANYEKISERQRIVDCFVQDSAYRLQIRALLKQTQDLNRLVGKIALNRGTPRDLVAIRITLGLLPKIQQTLKAMQKTELEVLANQIPLLDRLHVLLSTAVAEDPPQTCGELGIIAQGFNREVDQLRSLYSDSESVLAEFLEKEKDRTNIANLRIGFNKVIGFYLEVSKGKADQIPTDYIVKQTLTNVNRYITPELKDYEEKFLQAEHELKTLEKTICLEIFAEVLKTQNDLQIAGKVLAEIDAWAGLAELAAINDYVKPKTGISDDLKIIRGRHPVVETLLPTGSFTPNDLELDKDKKIMVLTGPNMGGKSTYLRQTALIVLLAHIGSFVPAEMAEIPIVDRIFTRVGASDNLSRGQSTFMVEMQELAVILNNATNRSLLLIDEVGRGTSTYDGVSVAWATLEYIHNEIGAYTLFATHYHELIDVAENLNCAANYSLAVAENNQQVTFLHKVQAGGTSDSYGLAVAKLAGIPQTVVRAAEKHLLKLESGNLARPKTSSKNPAQLDIFDSNRNTRTQQRLTNKLRQLKIEEMTPLAAIQALSDLQNDLINEH